jgi:outer membrane receptor for ferrienterochelin and colicin
MYSGLLFYNKLLYGMKKIITASLLPFFLMAGGISTAQFTVTGRVIDSTSQAPLGGVNIVIMESAKGTISDADGTFYLEVSQQAEKLLFSNVGYEPHTVSLRAGEKKNIDLGNVLMKPTVIGLNEVRIIAPEAVERSTPVAVSTITDVQIERRMGDEPFPEIMKMVPGVYATRTGGGSGDASVNIRGFKQENVALLLNGVPIGSVENGLVYWNNWLGLAEATQQVQVQRGLGASNIALNSVGGTINIITRTTDVEKGGSVKYSLTDYGNSRINLMLSTGRLKNNMAVTFMGSRISGSGYVDATYVDGWAYFLSVSKEFSKDHMLVFTALGNPERHGQRNFKLSKDETDRYGLKYNKEWGSYNGRVNNASENFYHKPHMSLNHYWSLNDKNFLATSLYFSAGKGGGKWTETFGNNPWIFSYYNPSGQIDWEAIYQRNHNNEDIYTLADGSDTSGYSVNIQTNFLASHVWTGIISTLDHHFNDNFTLKAGVHGRYFKSKLQQKVRDLLGGEFFIDDFAYAVEGVAGRDQIRHVGDIVKVDNGAIVNFISGFAQAEFTGGNVSAFIGGTVSGTWYRREDRYNYVQDIRSEWVSKPGVDIKAGINYNINEFHNVYLNGGYFSLAPYFKFVFGNYNNIPTRELNNEKVRSAEVGYGFYRGGTQVRLNAYIAQWKDKSVLTNEYNQFEDPVMLQGLDALHQGAELEVSQRLAGWFSLTGMLSLGDWKWKNNVSALLYNQDNAVVDTINVYADGLYVGDAPQFQAGLSASLKALKMFDITGQWVYYDRLYADFSPASRTDPADMQQSYRLPSYHLLDLFAGYGFKIAGMETYVQASCYNVLDHKHIMRGEDGAGHDLESFRGFWGFGRTFNFSVKVSF